MRLFLSFLLWEKDRVDVGRTPPWAMVTDPKTVQLLVVSDSKLDVSWDNSGLLVVTGGVTG